MPLDRAAAWGTPQRAAISSSKPLTWGPSGAIQLVSKASWTRSCSSPDMWGGER